MSAAPKITLVVAVAENGMIGNGNDLPWSLPGDLKQFKAKTVGKPVIMGRKTYESLGEALPNRPNIVISRNPLYHLNDAKVVTTLDTALALAREEAERLSADEISVIGGAHVFAEIMPRAERMYYTEVHASPSGDTRFPPFDRSEWQEVARKGPLQGPGDQYPYSFVTLERNSAR
ncbi:MAG TPA: dihydrofolate reductase [Xanthobacteraceae bacterium]|nr:dihydrofolate reductase [Xanthobacteraceae bacterium]